MAFGNLVRLGNVVLNFVLMLFELFEMAIDKNAFSSERVNDVFPCVTSLRITESIKLVGFIKKVCPACYCIDMAMLQILT